ncbi:MAG: hypothetical protein Q9227_008051 [Pyrenula ochraceoflavens]
MNQTAPFSLILQTAVSSPLNGTALASCHEGAAIEGLCVTSSPPSSNLSYAQTYRFNYSASSTAPDPSPSTQGYVVYELRGGNFDIFEPLGLSYNPASNVAVPLFYPDNDIATSMAFDENDLLNIQSYIDDTTDPPTLGQKGYYRWYVCTTYAGYTYQTLAWVLGPNEPENPTCTKVDVKRIFA